MIQKYNFWNEEPIEFDDSKSVKELLQYAFDEFEYYEPFGMEIVTLFQPSHPDTNVGWFTTDVNKSCAEEIKNRDMLCFAYNMPDVFYFAEGGWGHHMSTLGNHPMLENPVSLNLCFEDFDNQVVISGKYTFRDVISALKKTEYIPEEASRLEIRAVNPVLAPQIVSFDNRILDKKLTEFERHLPDAVIYIYIE